MTMSSLHARRLVATSFLFASVGMLACEGDPPTSPDLQIRAAKGGGGRKPVKVTEAIPPEGEQGATDLVVRVLGSGFDDGSEAAFHLPGEPNPDPKVKNKGLTRFVSESELEVTIDIELDAEVAKRDIVVTAFRGRRGIGTEKFEVKQKQPPGQTERLAFHISLADAGSGDALTNDGGGQNANCPLKLYCEGVDFVGAHLSGTGGGNNLMFWTSQYTNGGQASVRGVRIDVVGDKFDFHGTTDDRIFTNSNDPAIAIKDLGDGGILTSRMIVETEVGFVLRFGVDCFDNEARPTRVTVSRIGDVWTITPNGGAYLCRKTGKGKKAVTEQAVVPPVSFMMEMTKVGTI